MGFFLTWIQQVLLIIGVIQSLWFPALSLLFIKNTNQNLTTSNSKILAQPKRFRKSCEALVSVWNLAEIVPSTYTGLKLASGTRYYTSPVHIFITYTTTNRTLDMTDFFLVLAEVTTAAALVITLVTMSHESHSSWSPLPKNCPHFHLHYLNCQTWKLPHPLQQVSYNTLLLQQVLLIVSVRKKCTLFFWSTSAKSKPNHSVQYKNYKYVPFFFFLEKSRTGQILPKVFLKS